MSKNKIPVILITGYLGSGKTTLMQNLLKQEQRKIALIVNDMGSVNIDAALLNKNRDRIASVEMVELQNGCICCTLRDEFIAEIERISQLPDIEAVFVEASGISEPSNIAASFVVYTEDNPDTNVYLSSVVSVVDADRIVIEYNGMMHIADLIIGKPENWKIFQTVMIADASTFSMYEQNMRSLVVDKANICDVVIFNRYVNKADINELHRIIRSVNRRTEIYYEADNGMMIADDIEDPLPFKTNAPVVVIKDDDYAVWYSDIMNEAVKYHEKTVKFKAMIGSRPELPPNVFAVGRFIMTCCEADMEFCWFVAFYNRYHEVKGDIWALITAEITVQHHENENIDIPLLRITELYECAPPEIEIASF